MVTVMKGKGIPMPKQTAKQTKPDAVAAAAATLSGFEKQRAALLDKQAMLAERLRVASYEAHAQGDVKLIDGLTEEAVRLDHRIASLNDAIAEAERRLRHAQEAAARAAECEKAKELLDHLKQFRQYGDQIDRALQVLIVSTVGLQNTLTEINRCGSDFPSQAQLLSLGGRVLLGAMGKTPFRRNFETLPPLERDRSMAAIIEQWCTTVERTITQKLGAKETEAA
jgi:hypothetical protein